MFIHELKDRWAAAIAFAPLEPNDMFQREIKRAAKELVAHGKGGFMFDYQLLDLSTHWRGDELEQTIRVDAPPYVEPRRRVR